MVNDYKRFHATKKKLPTREAFGGRPVRLLQPECRGLDANRDSRGLTRDLATAEDLCRLVGGGIVHDLG